MKRVEILPATDGKWLYLVYFNGRIALIGLCITRERAEEQAKLA